jgi:hypothetical protein
MFMNSEKCVEFLNARRRHHPLTPSTKLYLHFEAITRTFMCLCFFFRFLFGKGNLNFPELPSTHNRLEINAKIYVCDTWKCEKKKRKKTSTILSISPTSAFFPALPWSSLLFVIQMPKWKSVNTLRDVR